MPPVGRPHTTFTFRMRVQPRKHSDYVVRVVGPVGSCHDTLGPLAVAPETSGPLRGLIKLGIGYGPLGLHHMCRGGYRGTVAVVRAGRPLREAKRIARFGFRVR